MNPRDQPDGGFERVGDILAFLAAVALDQSVKSPKAEGFSARAWAGFYYVTQDLLETTDALVAARTSEQTANGRM